MAALVPPCAASIRYGEFVESIYDTINPNDGEFWCFPLYGKSKLFAMANLNSAPHDGPALGHAYSVTRYIYCTVMGVPVFDVETGTAWIGYIAESTEEESQRLGRHDIVVVIRGTKGPGEWIKDFSYAFSDFPFAAPGAQVHGGFLSIYTSTDPALNFGAESMREQIFTELHAILRSHGAAEATLPVVITLTGHSLGAALATLVACDVGCNLLPKFANVTASLITFGSPKVGNDQFKIITEKQTAFIWRYRSIADPVPFVPPSLLGPYVHVGTELVLDWQPSPYVSLSIPSWFPFSMKGHNLELYMHVMAAENVYTSTQLEDLLGGFPLGGAGATYVIEAIAQMSAWDDGDHDLLKQELEDVKDCLKEDSSEMVAYLKEVNYIAVSRSRLPKNVAPRLHGAQGAESPFDRRDYSLLNKNSNVLKAEYDVPTEWLVHPNKDMIWNSSSNQWLPRVERPLDIPAPDNPEYN